MAWQFEMSSVNLLPAYGNIIVTIITTLFAVAQIYEGKFWNKCIFTIAFNAIWMLIETISGNILLTYCCEFTDLSGIRNVRIIYFKNCIYDCNYGIEESIYKR